MKNSQIFFSPPEDFASKGEAAGCYCNFNGKILFLKRHPNSSQGNTWGIPGGKLEKGEDARAAVIREIYEEVGFNINNDKLQPIGRIYVRLPHIEYIFHLFFSPLSSFLDVNLNLNEHLEYKWVTPAEALDLPLIVGGKEALQTLSYYLNKNNALL